jgi:hypothetical protein
LVCAAAEGAKSIQLYWYCAGGAAIQKALKIFENNDAIIYTFYNVLKNPSKPPAQDG